VAALVTVGMDEVSVHFVPLDQGVSARGRSNGRGHGSGSGSGSGATAGPAWTSILATPTTYDLLTHRDNPAVLGFADLGAGKITQIRLSISTSSPPQVVIGGVSHPLAVPSGGIKPVRSFDLSATGTTSITLAFDAARSIVQTGRGYLLRPVIQVVDGARP
jgi:hypothetical protein